MPRPRKYESRAQQQAAYRSRVQNAHNALVQSKGLPSLPAISGMPGYPRWKRIRGQAMNLLVLEADEMETYYEERSEAWQESERGEEFLVRIERLQDMISQLEELE